LEALFFVGFALRLYSKDSRQCKKNPPLSIGGSTKEKKHGLDSEQIYVHGSPAGHDARCEGPGWLTAVSFCFCNEKGSLKSETVKYGLQVPRDLDQGKTTLVMASSIYKRQTRPLIREDVLQKQDGNCQRVINIWS
jgi:hypothetical protein